MGYQIKPHKSVAREVRRVALGRLNKARKALLLPPEDRAYGVHQARKRLKEVRALVRLVREPLGSIYKQENKRLRDINRQLSAMRDASALVEAWDALAENAPEALSVDHGDIRQRLASRGGDGGQTLGESQEILNAVLADIAEAEAAVRTWPLAGKGFALLASGLERTVADGRAALKAACKQTSDERLHDWRKRVKDQWYHTRLLKAVWPAALAPRQRMLRDLSELLGQDHDLVLLQNLLNDEPELFGPAQQRGELAELISRRQEILQHDAFQLGQRLYAESPRCLRKRWGRYWKLARAEGANSASGN